MKDTKPLYSVLTYIVGNYETVHEIKEKSPNAEYILVTDNKALTSSTWTVVYVDNPHPEDPFDLCYHIRFHPFNYVNTDIVIRIDGSMGVNKSLDEIVDFFNNGWDITLGIHPSRANLYDEYVAWVVQRGYDKKHAEDILNFLVRMEGYDVKNIKGLYQYNFMIQRNNRMNNLLNDLTYDYLRLLAPKDKLIERLDQTIGSFVINKYFTDMKVLPVDQRLFHGDYFTWYAHGSDVPLQFNGEMSTPYLFNEEIATVTF